jgi:hypothetical protein
VRGNRMVYGRDGGKVTLDSRFAVGIKRTPVWRARPCVCLSGAAVRSSVGFLG